MADPQKLWCIFWDCDWTGDETELVAGEDEASEDYVFCPKCGGIEMDFVEQPATLPEPPETVGGLRVEE